jgi:plasmid stability protein
VPAIHIRNVPASMLNALRERAEAHGRSIEQEVLEILGAATAEPTSRPTQLLTTRTSANTTWRREDIYDDEGR